MSTKRIVFDFYVNEVLNVSKHIFHVIVIKIFFDDIKELLKHLDIQ